MELGCIESCQALTISTLKSDVLNEVKSLTGWPLISVCLLKFHLWSLCQTSPSRGRVIQRIFTGGQFGYFHVTVLDKKQLISSYGFILSTTISKQKPLK